MPFRLTPLEEIFHRKSICDKVCRFCGTVNLKVVTQIVITAEFRLAFCALFVVQCYQFGGDILK